MNDIKIENLIIGQNREPLIIAEMSGNHNQSIDKAMEILEAAADAGVHFLKLQTYTADTMTLDLKHGEFFIDDEESLWSGNSLYDLYKIAHTPWEWHEPLMKRARELGMICFSTPFDESAVDFLEDLDTPIYKVASFENRDLNLISKVASTGKPMIISTGMASIAEINDMVDTARNFGCKDLILLKCTSAYPSSTNESNIVTIPHMKKLFKCHIGLSDHTMGIGAAIAAVSHGAVIIEKHFTIDRTEGGVDSDFSLEPNEMSELVVETKQAHSSLGQIKYGATSNEKNSLIFRRSLYICEDMKKGDTLNKKNLRIIRPGLGLPPKYFKVLLGKQVKSDIKKGTAVTWDII
tara:strand:- start:1011 stop:2060 length:1050 start_codon:yes stop_codon:yes gene_type:complete